MAAVLRRRLSLGLSLAVGTWLALSLPFLPGGPDIYVHILWPQQVIRCLAQGQLPFWLPDLNAGFGSPGIRLYSPAGPFLVGVAGLLLGDVGRALRLAWLGALVALFLVARHWHRELPWWSGLLWVASPAVAFVLGYRAASSEILAMPLALWLLEVALANEPPARAEPFLWAGLWLLHLPSFLMTAGLAAAAAVLRRPFRRSLARRVVPMGLGLALASWHWLPLLTEASQANLASGLTEGLFDPRRNVLFLPQAHEPAGTGRLEALAVAWAIAAILAFRRDPRRAALAFLCLFMTSPLSYPLWAPFSPLTYLQFPWRFLTPASLLLPAAFSALSPAKRSAATLLFLIPHLWIPRVPLVSDPHVSGRETWTELGQKLQHDLSGNPLVVDAVQNRPRAFPLLAAQLQRFGTQTLAAGPGPVEVAAWRPLRRVLRVDAHGPGLVELRLLAYPYWRAEVDGRAVVPVMHGGIVAVPVPHGQHVVAVAWAGNPITAWGWLLAAGALVLALSRSGTP